MELTRQEIAEVCFLLGCSGHDQNICQNSPENCPIIRSYEAFLAAEVKHALQGTGKLGEVPRGILDNENL